MFVVPRNPLNAPDSSRTTQTQSRSAAQQRQRGAGAAAFSLPQAATPRTVRGEETTNTLRGSQNPVTPAVATANSTSVPAATTGRLEASGTGMQKLLDTMASLGMSTSGLNITYSEDFIGYPGGGYMNKQINVTAGGKTERFSADLTDRNPFVTAYELQSYFGVTPTANGANGNIRR